MAKASGFQALQARLAAGKGKGKISSAARASENFKTSWARKGARFAVKKGRS